VLETSIDTHRKKDQSLAQSSEAVTKATISKQMVAGEQSMIVESDNY